MKVAYLHGLESSSNPNNPKIIFLNNNFDSVYSPNINYKTKNIFNKIFEDIQEFKPDLIIGSSMGGYFTYLIGNKLSIPTLLFNPALVKRTIEPKVDKSNLKGTSHTVVFGEYDKVINSLIIKDYLKTHGIGTFTYKTYPGGHRVPERVFINEVKRLM